MYAVVFDADEEVAEKLMRNPGGDYYLKCIQADALYTGDPNKSNDGEVVFRILEAKPGEFFGIQG